MLFKDEILESNRDVVGTGLKSGDVVVILEERESTPSLASVGVETPEGAAFRSSVECSEDPDLDEVIEKANSEVGLESSDEDDDAEERFVKVFEGLAAGETVEGTGTPEKGGAMVKSNRGRGKKKQQQQQQQQPRRKPSGPPPGQLKRAGSKGSLGSSAMSLSASIPSLIDDPNAQRRFNKTHLCIAFKNEGKCPSGDSCHHAHGEKEFRRAPAPLLPNPAVNADQAGGPNNYKTSLCMAFKKAGSCPKGASCQYAHGKQELWKSGAVNSSANSSGAGGGNGAAKKNYKVELCTNFKANGKCPRGTSCQYAHGEKELRKPSEVAGKATALCSPMPRPVTGGAASGAAVFSFWRRRL